MRANLDSRFPGLAGHVFLALALSIGAVRIASAAPRQPVDAALSRRASASALEQLERLSRDPALRAIGVPEHVDERFAVPSFLVATRGAAARPTRAMTVEQAARQDLQRLAPYYRLTDADVMGAPLRYVSDTGEGGIVAVFQQEVDGIPVFREEMKVLLDRQRNLIAVSGSIPPRASATSHAFRLGIRDAIAAALSDQAGTTVAAGALRHLESREGGYELFDGATAATAARLSPDPIRARRVYFREGEQLVPAYYVELVAEDEAPAYVIAADDSRVLMRNDLLAYEAYNYRVWADSTGLQLPLDGPHGSSATPYPTSAPSLYAPPVVAPPLVSLQNGPISTNDPWLIPGALGTNGNNVLARLEGANIATPTSANTFDRTFDVNQQPDASTDQKMAGVTQVFYTINMLHDWFYDVGFTEAAGNPQYQNYGRGGYENDPIIAKTQISVNNNASMLTPADGSSPVMNNYLWSLGTQKQVVVNSPADFRGLPASGPSSSNAAGFYVTGDIALPFPGTFSATSSTLTAGSSPRQVQIGDLNGDGHPDLAVPNASSNTVSVFLSNGSGGFLAPTNYATGTSPRMVVTPDLNHDGLSDLVTANITGTLTVRLGTGGGAFGTSTSVTSGANQAVVVGRFDADGHDDVVTANPSSNNVSVLLGDGAGGFQPRVLYPMGFTPFNVAVGDLNLDGHADLVAANMSAGASLVSVRLGTGTGTFGAVTSDTVGGTPMWVALAELNGDGKLDIVTANNAANTVSVGLGNGNGTFGTPVSYSVPTSPVSVTLQDFNGDGLIDVIVACNPAGSVSLLANDGAGVLGAPQTIAVGTNPTGVALADVTGDGHPDVLTANSGSGNVTLLTGTVTPSSSICTPFANTLTGRIVLVPAFGGCSGTPDDKIAEAEARGAVGVLMEFSVALPYSAGAAHGIPAFIVLDTFGASVRTMLRSGTAVNASLVTGTPLRRDGALDNLIVAHEWAHSLSNRLVGNGNGLNWPQAGGMGEGWSDFVALLLTVRPEDAGVASNADWSGSYASAGHALSNSLMPDQGWYFGGRRYPYSTDFARNPLTFQHITAGVPLPVGPPQRVNGASNAEVHNVGEVWCNMLWECYASLLRDTGRLTFTQARDRMRRYLVLSLQLTPLTPTFVEARDAMLMAAFSTDAADYQLFRAAFARRGLGTGAVAPPRLSTDLSGLVESFVVGGQLNFVSLTVDDAINSCDQDGILDAGEDGYMTLKLWSPLMSSSLPGGSALFSSPNSNLQFPLGNAIGIPESQPGDTVSVKVRVQRTGTGIQSDSLYVQYDNPGWLQSGPRWGTSWAYGNIDKVPSATEDFEGASVASWSTYAIDGWGQVKSPPWARIQPDPGSPNWVFRGPIFGGPNHYNTDQVLVSPPLVVGSGDFSFTFKTTYQFATDPEGLCGCHDGGILQIWTDAVGDWQDIPSTAITPGYDHTREGGFLNNRPIFGGTSPGYPALITQTVNLGTAYANQTVYIRFWIEGDGHESAAGWWIDDIAFSGLTNTPFIPVVADPGPCGTTAVGNGSLPPQLAFAIDGANPSVSAPRFRFELPRPTHVTLSIYDVSGRRVATLADGAYSAGVFHTSWSGSAATGRHAGVYFARMVADGQVISRRVVVLGR